MPPSPTTACPRCGTAIVPGAHFCASCGNDISGQQGSLTTVQVPLSHSAADAAQAEMLELLRHATLGDYDIIGELGRGGMATVYLAHDIALDRRVAIKIMNPQVLMGEGMVDRFKREARTAAALSHPHIIPIYVVRETPRILYFVMKYVQGRGLDDIIKQQGALPIGMIEAILTQCAGALGYGHRRGVIHRDIKPANIMIDDEGWAVVMDFGIAKVAETRGLTMTGATVGTPYYMSPEQCSAKGITGSSDQYSLGIVAYEMLSGKPPFAGETIMEIMKSHFFDPPPPITEARADCPPALAKVVMRMLEKKPDDRWSTLEEASAAIGARTLTHDDPIHTQMVALAKSAPHIKPLPAFSTPISLPMGQRAAGPSLAKVSNAETVKLRTPPPAGRPSAPPAAAARPALPRQWRTAAAVAGVVLLGVAGWVGVKVLGGGGSGVKPAVDSVRTVPPRADTTPSAPPPPVVASLTVTPRTARLAIGDTLTLSAEPRDGQGRALTGRSVSWRSGAPAIVSVSAAGTVTAVTPGRAVVTAASEGKTGSVTLTVAPPAPPPPAAVATVEVRPASASVAVNQDVRLDATERDRDGNTLSRRREEWTSSDPSIASVSSNGVVTGVAAGNARITARSEGVASTPVTVTVTAAAASGKGVLQTLIQPWAYVSIGGLPRGQRTRGVDTVPAGVPHRLRFERPGFVTIDTIVTLRPGEQRLLRIQMTPRNP
jgi:serine/threonine protein kinase